LIVHQNFQKMNTSLLYHVFGLQKQMVIASEYKYGKVCVKIKTKEDKLQCSSCKSWNVIKSGTIERLFRTIPIGTKEVFLLAVVQRLQCKDCGLTRQEHLEFAGKKKTYTKSLERYILELSKIGTILDIANHLGVSWDLVKEIQMKYLQNNYSKPALKNVKHIAIDEFAVKKGHKYMTVVVDLDTGIIIFVGEGKGAEALEPFWKRIKRNKVKIEAVAMDMSPAYISAVSSNIPEAQIVFDHFHVIKLYNDELSNLRRDLYNQETELNKKNLLKGTRWLLLKNNENLNNEWEERSRLKEALAINEPLSIAYYLKEDLKLLWQQNTKQEAEKFLGKWVAKAMASSIPRLKKFANTLLAHRTGIFAWYDYPISTGPLEGINNKIKTMKRQAYGFRDMEFFKLKIYSLHEKNYALVG
jgi:transposase